MEFEDAVPFAAAPKGEGERGNISGIETRQPSLAP